MGDCHGRMIQEYNAESLHTQLKYLESLFDVERLKKKLEHQLLQNSGDSNLLRLDYFPALSQLLNQCFSLGE